MRLLRRNTTTVYYRPYIGKSERMDGTLHTGEKQAAYGDPVAYRGNVSVATGQNVNELFGVNTPYTHTLLLDMPGADIRDTGLIEWRGETYEIKGVYPSPNFLSIALKRRTTG